MTICLMTFCIQAQTTNGNTSAGYTDLGLPSGTKWKNFNATGYYTFDHAKERFGRRIPTQAQWEELVEECQWTWKGNGYTIKGPNGNSIFLPADGYRTCKGKENGIGYCGCYWSSTLYYSSDDTDTAVYFDFDINEIYMTPREFCRGYSIRLVQNDL